MPHRVTTVTPTTSLRCLFPTYFLSYMHHVIIIYATSRKDCETVAGLKGMALKAHVSKHPAAQCPLPLRHLDEEPPVQTSRPRPSATSPTLIRRRERSMHPQSALLRMWLPPPPHLHAACTSLSQSNRRHRRPPRERSLESWAICARHHELLAQEHRLSLAEVHAHIL